MPSKFGNAFAQQKEFECRRLGQTTMASSSNPDDVPPTPMTTMDMFIQPELGHPKQPDSAPATKLNESPNKTKKGNRLKGFFVKTPQMSGIPTQHQTRIHDAQQAPEAPRFSETSAAAAGSIQVPSQFRRRTSTKSNKRRPNPSMYLPQQPSTPAYRSASATTHSYPHASQAENWPPRSSRGNSSIPPLSTQSFATNPSQYGIVRLSRNDAMILSDTATAPTRFGNYASIGRPTYIHPPSMMSMNAQIAMASPITGANHNSGTYPSECTQSDQLEFLPATKFQPPPEKTRAPVPPPVSVSATTPPIFMPPVEFSAEEQLKQASPTESVHNLNAQGQSCSQEHLETFFKTPEVESYKNSGPRRSRSDNHLSYSSYPSGVSKQEIRSTHNTTEQSKALDDHSTRLLESVVDDIGKLHSRFDSIDQYFQYLENRLQPRFNRLDWRLNEIATEIKKVTDLMAQDSEMLATINVNAQRLLQTMTRLPYVDQIIPTPVSQPSSLPAPVMQPALVRLPPHIPLPQNGGHHETSSPPTRGNSQGHMKKRGPQQEGPRDEVIWRKPSSGERMTAWYSAVSEE